MDILELRNVSKRFGSLEVLKDLTFRVPEGSVFGFIGKNGAGKTTTMKMILGFLPVSGGEIQVCGERVTFGSTKTNRLIGYLPDVPEFYGYMRPDEYLWLCGRAIGLAPEAVRARTKELLALVGLDGVRRRIGGFSRGMKQRLGIAQALIGEPKLLICDEPTSALDPVGRREILEILHQIKSRTTIVFSTHILSDVERVCDTVGILHGGKLALSGALEEIRNTYRKDAVRVELTGEADAQKVSGALESLPGTQKIEREGSVVTVRLQSAEAKTEVFSAIALAHVPVVRYETLEPALEDVFLEVIA